MEIAIFAKRLQSTDGRIFYKYLSTLKKKDGTELKVQIKFRQDCGNPKGEECPMNILVERDHANLSFERYSASETNPETGEVTITEKQVPVLWVNAWKKGKVYVDHSLDEIAD